MNTFIVAIVRTRRIIRCGPTNPISRFTPKVSINLALTTGLPAFIKLAIDWNAYPSRPENRLPDPANNNTRQRSRKRTA